MQDLRELFGRAGLRCTKQRQEVYAALAATKSHPTAEELHNSIRTQDPGLSLATVYNTLEAFTRRGLCRRLPPATGSAACRYDADTMDHAHLAYPDGRVADLPADLSERLVRPLSDGLIAEIERRMGVRVGGMTIQVIGRGSVAAQGGQDSSSG